MKRYVEVGFNAAIVNVTFARGVVASFFMDDDLPLNIINEVKTIVSEAVTNAIVHGYNLKKDQTSEEIVNMIIEREDNLLTITISDNGLGIEDIEKAKQPLFSTKLLEERAGLGFTIMEIFSDNLKIISSVCKGTTIIAKKYLA